MANPLSSVWEEFKQAPPGGKALAITAVVAVAGIGLYVGHHNSSNAANPSNTLPVDLSTVPDTGVPFANLPANPPVSTGTTGSTGGTTPPVPPKTTPPKGGKDTDDKRKGFHTNPGSPNQSGHGIHSGGAIPPNLHPHTTGIHSITSPPGGTILR